MPRKQQLYRTRLRTSLKLLKCENTQLRLNKLVYVTTTTNIISSNIIKLFLTLIMTMVEHSH